jgi:hypothetical protein
MMPAKKSVLVTFTAGAVALASTHVVQAQYAPPPPLQPFPGFLNDYLRKQDPYLSVLDLGGAVRLRYEVRENGLGLPPAQDFRRQGVDNDNSYFSDKLLARVAYTDEWWSLHLEGRSSSTTGDQRGSTGTFPGPGAGPESDGPVDLHQAFFTLGNHKQFPVSLKIGRQELLYGDERLVGPFGWNNIGRVFDTAKVRWQNPLFVAEAFTGKIVLPDDNNFNMWNDYNLFSGLHITTKEIPKTATELYFFARNDGVGSTLANPGAFPPFQVGAPAARDIYTIGARFKSNPGELGKFDYTVEGAYQFGNWKPTIASARLDHNAYAFMANIGYTLDDGPMAPRVALEYAHGSGDSNPTDENHDTFDNLYPTNHKFYGYMDLLSWQNLDDVRAIFTIKPHPRLSIALEGHAFWLADTSDSLYNVGGVARTTPGSTVGGGNGFNNNPSYGSYIGSEVDLVAGFLLTKFATLEAGYGHFFVGDYIDQTWSAPGFGATDADWIYIQALVRF